MPPGPSRPRRVLIISASMGAGHDGAARELASRIAEAGHDVEVRDFLDSGPLHMGAALRRGYEFELRHAPAAYDATYRFWHRAPWLCPLVAWLVAALSRRRVLRWVGASRLRRTRLSSSQTAARAADVVVSTYPLATLALGRLRRQGRLRVPVVNFITDFGVHPLWVHKGVDVNLAVHRRPAEVASSRSGRPSLACGPVVSSAFHRPSPEERSLARARFGLLPADRAVLIVAGSWGIGEVEETLRAVAGSGRRYVPVVVCGSDDQLLARMQACTAGLRSRSVVLGWTDQMPAIMAACDALVENAGGLTSLEAFRSGLPVVSYQPIAGHGKENTAAMAAAGVSRFAGDAEDLAIALEAVTSDCPEKWVQVATAAEMFADDGAALVLAVAGDTSLIPSPVPGAWQPAR
ncbi:MAG: glycosyltransferase, partial [Acidimicrobiaceae bacterium]|nr:glycosyltransferase [Acidimicrobiaceae bacterium]